MGRPSPAESVLFTWPIAQLFLVDQGGACVLMQSGFFSLLLTRHSRYPHLALVEAAVSDLRWPVGKDSLVTLLDSSAYPPARFLFVFPGPQEQLVYELLLQRTSSSHNDEVELRRLQALLGLYASLCEHKSSGLSNSATTKELEDAAGKYWARVAASRSDCGKGYAQLKHFPEMHCGEKGREEAAELQGLHAIRDGASNRGQGSGSSRSYRIASTASAGTCVSKRMMKRVQKARRVSAVAKLFSKVMVKGVISGAAHIVQEAFYNEEAGQQCKVSKEKLLRPAVAKVEAITKVVEAVERGVQAAEEEEEEERRTYLNTASLINSSRSLVEFSANLATWTLNKVGLQMLINVVVAANYIQSGGNMTSSHSSSSITSLHNSANTTSAAAFTGTSNSSSSSACRRPPRSSGAGTAHQHQLNEATSPLVLNSTPTLGQS